jgi:hypothetical protein
VIDEKSRYPFIYDTSNTMGTVRRQRLVPEIDPAAWRGIVAVRQLPAFFTVAICVGLVKGKPADTFFASAACHGETQAPR